MTKITAHSQRQRLKHFLQRMTGLTISRGVPRGVSLAQDLKAMNVPVNVVFDIGANVGKAAIDYAGFWPQAAVYSFEPVQSTFDELVGNTKHLSNVQRHQLAFGDEAGEAEIHLHSRSDLNTLRKVGEKERDTEVIQVDTVDRFCEQQGIDSIDLMKTDTEGFEREVIAGAQRMLVGSIQAVLIEVCFGESTERHVALAEISELLGEHGLVLSAFYDQFSHRGDRNLVFANALFVRNEADG